VFPKETTLLQVTKLALVAALSIGALAGCSPPVTKETRIENVVRVFFNGNDEYTVLIPENGKLRPIIVGQRMCNAGKTTIALVPDVPANEPMWVKKTALQYDDTDCIGLSVELHIRSEGNIEGGTRTESRGSLPYTRKEVKIQTQVVQ
jgi:hypothetical protein